MPSLLFHSLPPCLERCAPALQSIQGAVYPEHKNTAPSPLRLLHSGCELYEPCTQRSCAQNTPFRGTSDLHSQHNDWTAVRPQQSGNLCVNVHCLGTAEMHRMARNRNGRGTDHTTPHVLQLCARIVVHVTDESGTPQRIEHLPHTTPDKHPTPGSAGMYSQVFFLHLPASLCFSSDGCFS